MVNSPRCKELGPQGAREFADQGLLWLAHGELRRGAVGAGRDCPTGLHQVLHNRAPEALP